LDLVRFTWNGLNKAGVNDRMKMHEVVDDKEELEVIDGR
jgi:hypothetical protein